MLKSGMTTLLALIRSIIHNKGDNIMPEIMLAKRILELSEDELAIALKKVAMEDRYAFELFLEKLEEL